jgi:hypothetical protein
MSEWNTSEWGASDDQADELSVVEERPPARGLGVKRAMAGGAVGVALLVGPIGLAKAMVPAEAPDIEIDDTNALFASLDRNSSSVAEHGQATVNEALAVQEVTLSGKDGAATSAVTTTTTTTEPPSEGDHQPDTGAGFGNPGDYATWDALAQCESTGNWSINTGNGYYGGLQFSLATWQSVGGTGYPHEHSREEQIHRGQILQARAGWGQWPHCSSRLGFR